MSGRDPALPRLGVVIVTYGGADLAKACLTALLASDGVALDVVVVDNASLDGTAAALRSWIAGHAPRGHRLRLVEAEANRGFAAGVNQGLSRLTPDPGLDRFWILNPDTEPAPEAARAFATHPGRFGLMGGRVVYATPPGRVQIDGGRIDRRTGVTRNLNRGAPGDAPPPVETADFVTGASLVASRAFLERAGPMAEDYFLYYEEVDWAMRRGDLPLIHLPDAVVRHHAGAAIGSAKAAGTASPLSQYCLARARRLFVRRHMPWARPGALAYGVAKSARLALSGHEAAAAALLRGALGLRPPKAVADRLDAGARSALGLPAQTRTMSDPPTSAPPRNSATS